MITDVVVRTLTVDVQKQPNVTVTASAVGVQGPDGVAANISPHPENILTLEEDGLMVQTQWSTGDW